MNATQLNYAGGFQPISSIDAMQADVDLAKAIATNATYGTSYAGMMPEDLELEAKGHIVALEDFQFARLLPNVSATNEVHQFNRITGYGKRGRTGFYPQNSIGSQSDIVTERDYVTMKCFGEINQVTGMAGAVKSIRALGAQDPVQINRASTLLSIIQKLAKAEYFSDNLAAVTTSILPFRGLRRAIIVGNAGTGPLGADITKCVDMRGFPLTKDTIRGGTKTAAKSYGRINHLFMAPDAMEELEKDLAPTERIEFPRPAAEKGLVLSAPITGMYTQSGYCAFHVENILSFEESWGQPLAAVDIDALAPALPAWIGFGATVNAGPIANSLWQAADAAATIGYKISACNDIGEGPPSAATAGAAVAATDSVKLDWTSVAGIKSYKVYRNSAADLATYYLIHEIAGIGGAPHTWTDLNNIIPGTTHAFGIAWSTVNDRVNLINPPNQSDTVVMARLINFVTMPLAFTTDVIVNEMIKTYLALEVQIPNRLVMYYNIGNRS